MKDSLTFRMKAPPRAYLLSVLLCFISGGAYAQSPADLQPVIDDGCSPFGQMKNMADRLAHDGTISDAGIFVGAQGQDILQSYDQKFKRFHPATSGIFMMRFAHTDGVFVGVVDEERTKVCDASVITTAEWDAMQASAYGPRASLARGEG